MTRIREYVSLRSGAIAELYDDCRSRFRTEAICERRRKARKSQSEAIPQ
jgi:hypothetical protein